MFKNSEEFRAAGEKVLEMCEQHERGEISADKLLTAWKQFTRMGFVYLNSLKEEINSNPNWS